MQVGDKVRFISGNDKVYVVSRVKSDHRGLWVQLDDSRNLDVYYNYKLLEVLKKDG